MNKPLAHGHETGQKTPATAMPEDDVILLSEIPLIAEIEALIRAGKSWSAEFQPRVDAASVALFGLTAADTWPVAPSQHEHYKGRSLDEASWQVAVDAYHELDADLVVPEADRTPYDQLIAWWWEAGVIVTDDAHVPLRCLSFFERQLNAALFGLLPNARLTLDGTGCAGPQPADAWGAALAAQAEEFTRRSKR